jgi:hypothetical protein
MLCGTDLNAVDAVESELIKLLAQLLNCTPEEISIHTSENDNNVALKFIVEPKDPEILKKLIDPMFVKKFRDLILENKDVLGAIPPQNSNIHTFTLFV